MATKPKMTDETKANIGYACVVAFIAAFVFTSWIIGDYNNAHESIEQYTATTFDTPPTEVIHPHFGAVSFNWNGMHYVIHECYWNSKTGVYDVERY